MVAWKLYSKILLLYYNTVIIQRPWNLEAPKLTISALILKLGALHNNACHLPEKGRTKPLTRLYLQTEDLLTPLQSIHASSCAEVKPRQLRWILVRVYLIRTKHPSTPATARFVESMCAYEGNSFNVTWSSKLLLKAFIPVRKQGMTPQLLKMNDLKTLVWNHLLHTAGPFYFCTCWSLLSCVNLCVYSSRVWPLPP